MLLFEVFMLPFACRIFWNEEKSIKNWKETLGSRNLGLIIKYGITLLSFNYSKMSPSLYPVTND